jgi:hypothetical protein
MSAYIGEVIGWKFNHQPGMSTRDGIITEFPGGIPSQELQEQWTAEYETHIANQPPVLTEKQRLAALEEAMKSVKPDFVAQEIKEA